MSPADGLVATLRRFEQCVRPTRIVALGSSNTARGLRIGNVQNWVDWIDTGLSRHYGRCHITINAGISGQTSRDLLARFETDVALFQPHLLIVTVGGNDASADKEVSPDEFLGNLLALVSRARRIPTCVPVLQTYYAFDDAALAAAGRGEYVAAFHHYMELVREAARQSGAVLLDPLPRWERFRAADPVAHRGLLHDPQHLNALGNMVFAWDVLRALGATPQADLAAVCAAATSIRERMDALDARAAAVR